MPCDQVRTVSIVLGDKTNIKVLSRAFELAGYKITVKGNTIVASREGLNVTFQNGKLNFTGSYYNQLSNEEAQQLTKELKRRYSEVVIAVVAKKNGFKLNKGSASNKFKVTLPS